MPHFVSLQQSYSTDASPEALSALKHCLKFLPKQNHAVLKYIIQHLVKVADYSDKNKMTSVSLSIVFGPNLFHCDSGLEGLKTQGFCNSCVCRMIQNHKVLFDDDGDEGGDQGTGGTKKKKQRKRAASEAPAKPQPYHEYKANKSRVRTTFMYQARGIYIYFLVALSGTLPSLSTYKLIHWLPHFLYIGDANVTYLIGTEFK